MFPMEIIISQGLFEAVGKERYLGHVVHIG